MTVPLFEEDAYRRECQAEVVASGSEDGRPWVVLSQTVLYPEGGGQPADRGFVDEVEVVDVQRRGEDILHLLAAPLAAGQVRVRLDWPRRFDHMQQHTAQHLLTAVAADRFAWATTAFHLGETTCDIELDVPALTPGQLAALEEAVAQEIRAARPVRTRRVGAAEFARMEGVRSRGLPADHVGEVRLVEIEGVDCNTCGGTHLRSTAEIEALAVLGSEPMRGGTRLFFVAGGRLRRRLAAHESRNAALRTLLGAPDHELPEAVAARLEVLRALEKKLSATEAELAEAMARELARTEAPFVEAHFEERELAFLQRLARTLAAAAPDKAAFLSARAAAGACFVLVAGAHCPLDVQACGREVATRLGGRGGGSGQLFQGKAPALDGREAALAWLRAALEGR
ncbi:MAG: alanyl-tRNA editing protein [Thermoanaerobaculaceae bacterium]|nr:alanyl-tRNA editing protein [Thermoanaerobaculaceae bacterium]